MPNVDVTQLFIDPDFASPLLWTTVTETVDDHGRAQFASTQTTIVGVIQPASGRTLAMLPDLVLTSGAVEVWCTADLKESAQGRAPDEICWLGQTYTVTHVDPWRNEGTGTFTHAVCELKPLQAPTASSQL